MQAGLFWIITKISEYGKIIKEQNDNKVVLVKSGNFYRCFDKDAIIVYYLLNYKLTEDLMVGFPVSSLGKVLVKLKNNNVSSIILNDLSNTINYNCTNNKYKEVLNDSINYLENSKKIDLLIDEIRNILSMDISNYEKFKKFLNEL